MTRDGLSTERLGGAGREISGGGGGGGRRRSGSCPARWQVALLFQLLIWLAVAPSSTVGSCAQCLNGGQNLLPNNIFGFCRCKCGDGYLGPQCQFDVGKRSGRSGSSGDLKDLSAAARASGSNERMRMRMRWSPQNPFQARLWNIMENRPIRNSYSESEFDRSAITRR